MQRVWSAYLDPNDHGRDRSGPHSIDNISPPSSRRDSVSGYSHAGSTRHMLADTSVSSSSHYGGVLLSPPSPPFATHNSRDNLSVGSSSSTNLSLSVNYLPNKFSSSVSPPGGARYRGTRGGGLRVPKRGGGLEAFKSNESRMPQAGKHRLRWNRFKWVLFITNAVLSIYSLAALVVCLLTWFDVWENADVVRAGNRPELVLSTMAACVGVFTSVIGWAGILLNDRSFLAWYTFLTWVTFAFLLIPGYITYKRRTFNLEGKINAQWSRFLGAEGRLRIQNQLRCCGYFDPFVEATVSQTCYARSVLPGCKLPYLQFERRILMYWFRAVFILVPIQLAVMLAGLLCSNHITYRFGKGMMPEAYRLNLYTMAAIMENYANELAEQYGQDLAADVYKQSQARLQQLESMPTVPYAGGRTQHRSPMSPFHAKYESVNNPRMPDTTI